MIGMYNGNLQGHSDRWQWDMVGIKPDAKEKNDTIPRYSHDMENSNHQEIVTSNWNVHFGWILLVYL